MPATNLPICCRAAPRGSCSGAAGTGLQTGAPFETSEQTDNITPMIRDIHHHPSYVPGAVVLAAMAVLGCGAAGYREARLTQPAELVTRGFSVEVARVFLNEETVTDGVADGTALVVELEITNGGATPYQLNPGQ